MIAADRPAEGTLAGQQILVAGAAGRIGTAVTAALASRGASLVLHSRAPWPASPGHAAVHGDITEPADLAGLSGQLSAAGVGVLDAVVNCTTGFDGRPVPAADLTAKEFRRVIDTDLTGSFLLVQELLPLLAAGSKVVLFSSLAAIRGRPGAAHLCAAKAGIQGLAAGLARDLAPRGVLVHVVAPGPVGPHPGLPAGAPFSTPEEVAGVVAFLATDAADPVGGQVITIQPGSSPREG